MTGFCSLAAHRLVAAAFRRHEDPPPQQASSVSYSPPPSRTLNKVLNKVFGLG